MVQVVNVVQVVRVAGAVGVVQEVLSANNKEYCQRFPLLSLLALSDLLLSVLQIHQSFSYLPPETLARWNKRML